MIRIEIPNYIREIKISNARMIKYYKLGKKIPAAKKYLDKTKYDYKEIKGFKDKFLVDLATGERVIANPKSAGTPRSIIINGQKIYNGDVNKHLRNKVISSIKESFAPHVNSLSKITEFPVKITLEVHDTIRDFKSNNLWDLDNRSMPYIKAFQDTLTGNKDKTGTLRNKKILQDDNILYITQPPVPKFIPVDNEEDRKLVFIIEKEEDERILNHKEYQEELNKLKIKS